MRKLFIFGFGFSAQSVAEKLRDEFDTICGTTRSHEKRAKIEASGFDAVVFDGSTNIELENALKDATHILISIAPKDMDPVLTALPNLKNTAPNLQWIGYLSTVGVYGNHDGDWVDEETPVKPVSKRSKDRVDAEAAWQTFADECELPLGIFRLSGIYGPGRNWFVTIEKGKSRRLVKPGQVFNRIHREDIGSAVAIAAQHKIGGIFNITDDDPAPPQDVVTYAHELMGLEPPAEIDFETADISPMARSFYGENKRVKNAKSKEILGMTYAWPNYRHALKKMWEEGSWK